MNQSPCFINMKDAINTYIEKSSRKEYRFTEEEEYQLTAIIRILNNQLRILQEYESKKRKEF